TGLQSGATSIHTILELMTAMTKQITILSLNASIEAVRAGTTGTGFKVIADEIRTLAEQSSRSIIDVGRHMTQIQTEIGGTITAVHDALPIFEEMVEEVRAVSQVIEEVH